GPEDGVGDYWVKCLGEDASFSCVMDWNGSQDLELQSWICYSFRRHVHTIGVGGFRIKGSGAVVRCIGMLYSIIDSHYAHLRNVISQDSMASICPHSLLTLVGLFRLLLPPLGLRPNN